MKLPRYFDYEDNTFKVVQTAAGNLRGYLLNTHTGKFQITNSLLNRVLYSGLGENTTEISKEEFIELTEELRASHLQGDGPIFSIYETIDNWFDQRDSLSEPEWRNKRDFITELRHRTYHLWEEEFERQAAGAPPSFAYQSVAGSAAAEKYSYDDTTPDRTLS